MNIFGMDTKQLAYSARQHTSTPVVGVQKVSCQAKRNGFGASAILLGLVIALNFMFPPLKVL
jgi:hypothetical protein